jgi:hypothetical protein
MRLPIVLALAALALGAPGHAAAKPHGRNCGDTPRIHGQRFAVYEEQGRAACRTVKPVMTHYLRTFAFSRPWFCTLGHGNSPFAASCAKGDVVLRAYAPAAA